MTVFYRQQRDRWSYEFVVQGKRHAGYCLEEDGTPCASRRAAERAEERIRVAAERSQRTGAPLPVAAVTLAQGLALYAAQADKAKANWHNQVDYMRELAGFFGPETPLAEIDHSRIWAYVEWARQQPMRVYVGGPKKAAEHRRQDDLWKETAERRTDSTINRYLICLRKMFGLAHKARDAARRRLLEDPPEVPALKRQRHLPRPIADADVAKLLQAAAPHIAEAAALSLLLGLRRAEAFGLTVDHVDFQHQGIWLAADETKGDRAEFLPANAKAMQLLRFLASQAEARGTRHLVTWRRREEEADGTPAAWLPIRDPKSAIRTAMKKAGLQGRHRFHDLKASFSTGLAHVAPGRVVQQLSRHKSFETTQGYLLVADSAMRQAMNALDGRAAVADVDLTKPLGKVPTKVPTSGGEATKRRKLSA